VLARRTRMCNFLEYKGRPIMMDNSSFTADTSLPDSKIVYRRYASLFFIAGCNSTDNELITLEIVHRYVEQMDKYYGNVCEVCERSPPYRMIFTNRILARHRATQTHSISIPLLTCARSSISRKHTSFLMNYY
jgi:hypothetical protein